MDISLIAGCTGVIIAALSLAVTLRHRGQDTTRLHTIEALRPGEVEMSKLQQDLEKQESGLMRLSSELTELKTSVATVRQQLADHEAAWRERMTDVSSMFEEIRQDIKTLIGGVRP